MSRLTLIPGLFLFGSLLTACGADTGNSDNSASTASRTSDLAGDFSVTDSLGGGFSSESPRARATIVQDTLIELRAGDDQVRVHASNLPDAGPGESTELIGNNVLYIAQVEIGGQATRVICTAADPVQGRFNRTALTATTISGEFEFELVRCEDYLSAAAVAVPGLPFTVRASFEGLQLDD